MNPSLQTVAISRRALLQGTAVAAVGMTLGNTASADDSAAIPTLDAHTHFYDPTRPQGVPWPDKGDAVLYRKVMPAEFETLSRPFGVTSTIIVEASKWVDDNQWVLDLAAKDPFIAGVVGHLDPGDENFGRDFSRYAPDPLFVGIRVNHEQLKPGLDSKSYLANLKRLVDRNLELDVLGGPTLPADVGRLARQFPDLRIVINHLSNVLIDGKPVPADWRKGMESAAEGKNVYCKVSALAESTRLPRGQVPADVNFYRPVLDAVWESFGEDRLIYASNWPVSEKAASYAAVHGIASAYFKDRGTTVSAKFFRGNAEKAYRVKPT